MMNTESASASVYGGSIRSDPGGIPQDSPVTHDIQENSDNSRQSINSIYSTGLHNKEHGNTDINTTMDNGTRLRSELQNTITDAAVPSPATNDTVTDAEGEHATVSANGSTATEIDPCYTTVCDRQTKL